MGNCQSADAAADTVVVEHPGGNGMVERFYSSLSVNEVMDSNPGNYVALIYNSTATPSVKQLKLLSPDDTLQLGHVYRLIPFEDVLTLFATKKSVRVGSLVKENGGIGGDNKTNYTYSPKGEQVDNGQGSGNINRGVGRHLGQWKPALQSIAEGGF